MPLQEEPSGCKTPRAESMSDSVHLHRIHSLETQYFHLAGKEMTHYKQHNKKNITPTCLTFQVSFPLWRRCSVYLWGLGLHHWQHAAAWRADPLRAAPRTPGLPLLPFVLAASGPERTGRTDKRSWRKWEQSLLSLQSPAAAGEAAAADAPVTFWSDSLCPGWIFRPLWHHSHEIILTSPEREREKERGGWEKERERQRRGKANPHWSGLKQAQSRGTSESIINGLKISLIF